MTPSLNEVEPSGKAIVTARRKLLDGTTEPALDIYPARTQGSEAGTSPDVELFMLVDPDPFYDHRKLGVMAVEHVPGEPDHLKMAVDDVVSGEPSVLHDAVAGLMESLHEQEVIVAESDTNLSARTLRQIGSVGLAPGVFEIQRAA
jgi:hypothetical protein